MAEAVPLDSIFSTQVIAGVDGHWYWRGRSGGPATRRTFVQWEGCERRPYHHAWHAVHGQGRTAALHAICADDRCIAPEHWRLYSPMEDNPGWHAVRSAPTVPRFPEIADIPADELRILTAVSRHYRVTIEAIRTCGYRRAEITEPRWVAMALLSEQGHPPAHISRIIRCNHATVNHALERAGARYAAQLAMLRPKAAPVSAHDRVAHWLRRRVPAHLQRALAALVFGALLPPTEPRRFEARDIATGHVLVCTRFGLRAALLSTLREAGLENYASLLELRVRMYHRC